MSTWVVKMFDDRLRLLGEAHSVHTLTNRVVIPGFYSPAEYPGDALLVDILCKMTIRIGDQIYRASYRYEQSSCNVSRQDLFWDEEILDLSNKNTLYRETRNPILGIKLGQEWVPFYYMTHDPKIMHYLKIADLHALNAIIRENRMLFWDRTNHHFWQYAKWGPSVIYMSEDWRSIDHCETYEYTRLDREFHTEEATWSSTQYEYLAKEMDHE